MPIFINIILPIFFIYLSTFSLRHSATPVEINTETVNSFKSTIFGISMPVNCMVNIFISFIVRATKSSNTLA